MKSVLIIGNDDHERQARITRMIMERLAKEMDDKFIEACGFASGTMKDSSSTASTSSIPSTADMIMSDILTVKASIEKIVESPTPSLVPWSIGNKFRDGIGCPSFPTFTKTYTNPLLTEQFRFPVSKKRRIRKKWSKRPENFRPSRSVYMFGEHGEGGIFCHPVLEEELRSVGIMTGVTT